MAGTIMSTAFLRFSLLFAVFFLTFVSYVEAITSVIYDIDELRRISYSIDILDTPLRYGEMHSNKQDEGQNSRGIMLSNKFGKPFHCSYDTTPMKSTVQDDHDETIIDDSTLLIALKELSSQYCLTRTYHWWTYEFCYGRNVTQYHLENGQRSGDIITLGLFESDFNWSAPNVNETDEYVHRYHSQRYVNGTECEPTAGFRSVFVKFTCGTDGDETDSTGVNVIYDVSEVTTCQYVVSMRMEKLCRLKRLRRTFKKSSVSIECHPVLNRRPGLIRARRDAIVKVNEETQHPVNDVINDVSKNSDVGVVKLLSSFVTDTDESDSMHILSELSSFIEPREVSSTDDNRAGDDGSTSYVPASTQLLGTEKEASIDVNDEKSDVNVVRIMVNDAKTEVHDAKTALNDASASLKDVENDKHKVQASHKDSESPTISVVQKIDAETGAVSAHANEIPVTKMKFHTRQPYNKKDIHKPLRHSDNIQPDTSSNVIGTTPLAEITEIEVMHVDKMADTERGREEVGDSYMKWTGPGGKVYRITTNELTTTVTVYVPLVDGDVIEESVEIDDENRAGVGPTALERVKNEMRDGPTRRTEVKIINVEYYDENGKPVAKKVPGGFKKEVAATFRKNDEEFKEFEKHRTLERHYNVLRNNDEKKEKKMEINDHFE